MKSFILSVLIIIIGAFKAIALDVNVSTYGATGDGVTNNKTQTS